MKSTNTTQATPGNRPCISPETITAILAFEADWVVRDERLHQLAALAEAVIPEVLQLPHDRERIGHDELNRQGWLLGLLLRMILQASGETAQMEGHWRALSIAKSRGELQMPAPPANGTANGEATAIHPGLGIPPKPATPTEIQAGVGQLVSELFGVQALLRLGHFSLETIAARDPDRIGVDADDLARVSALALEKLEAITLRLDGVWPVIGQFGGGDHG